MISERFPFPKACIYEVNFFFVELSYFLSKFSLAISAASAWLFPIRNKTIEDICVDIASISKIELDELTKEVMIFSISA
jgi:hypothetical protein